MDKHVAEKRRPVSTRRHPSFVILVVTAFERFALYGVLCNIDLFLDLGNLPSLGLSSQRLSITLLLALRLPYIGAFLAGALADSKFGRYKVFFVSLILQLFGSVCLLLSAIFEEHKKAGEPRSEAHDRLIQALVYSGLTMIALGLSSSSGTEIPLGVDQYRPGLGRYQGAQGPQEAAVFFHRYYFTVNCGTFLSYTVLSFVQVNESFVVGLAPTCIAYVAAVTVLHVFRHRLSEARVGESTLHTACAVVKHALKAKWSGKSNRRDIDRAQGERETLLLHDVALNNGGSWLDKAKSAGFTQREIVDVRKLGWVTAVLLSLSFYLTSLLQVRARRHRHTHTQRRGSSGLFNTVDFLDLCCKCMHRCEQAYTHTPPPLPPHTHTHYEETLSFLIARGAFAVRFA